METLIACIIGVVVYMFIITVISIKNKENIFANVKDFFAEWCDYIKTTGIWAIVGLGILALLCWAAFE